MNIIFKKDGGITKFAFWTTLLIIVIGIYLGVGYLMHLLQTDLPVNAR